MPAVPVIEVAGRSKPEIMVGAADGTWGCTTEKRCCQQQKEKSVSHGQCNKSPNDPKLSDDGGLA